MRPWKPLPAKRLKAIIAETEPGDEGCDFSDDDVYRLAREVEALRPVIRAARVVIGDDCVDVTDDAISALRKAMAGLDGRSMPRV